MPKKIFRKLIVNKFNFLKGILHQLLYTKNYASNLRNAKFKYCWFHRMERELKYEIENYGAWSRIN